MTETGERLKAVRRGFTSLWGWLVLDRLADPLGVLLAERTRATPLMLTWASIVLGSLSAMLFAHGAVWAVMGAVLLYQASVLADSVDGLVARLRPGSGSVAAMLLDHGADPWRLVANVAAVAWAATVRSGSDLPLVLAVVLVAVHFTDWVLPDLVADLRRAVRQSAPTTLTTGDIRLLTIKAWMERRGLRTIVFGGHEREVLVLGLAPLAPAILVPVFALTIAVSAAFVLLRVRLDLALLRSELVTGTQEYLGDSINAWERRRK